MLCFNEVGLRGEQANIFWELERDGEKQKMPIYEVHVGKNKYGSFKGRLFYRLTPWMSVFEEVDSEMTQRYAQMVSS